MHSALLLGTWGVALHRGYGVVVEGGLWELEREAMNLDKKETKFVKYLMLVATEWCLWLYESAL